MEDYVKKNLRKTCEGLNDFIERHNRECSEQGGLRISKQVLQVVGQMALFLADLPFPITSTTDLDLATDPPPHLVITKLRELLSASGITLAPDGRLIWMPENTRYHLFFDSPWVQVLFADSEDVLLSKYKFNRTEDRKLIQTYLEYFPGFQKVLKESGTRKK